MKKKNMLSNFVFTSKKKLILLILFLLSIIFICLHITPEISIRTWLFSHGHIKGSLLSEKIEFSELETQLGLNEGYLTKGEEVYIIKDSDIEYWETGNILYSVKVKKYGFIYFGEYYCHEG